MIIKAIKSLIAFSALMTTATSTMALDVENYQKLTDSTIRQMNSGVVGDIDTMIAMQEKLMVIAIEGGKKYLQQEPKDGTPLKLVIENAESMKSLTLDEIEALWHGGLYLKERGIDPEKIDHFGPIASLMDSVIHPATSYLLIKEYKRTGNPELLTRVKAELFEVLEHIKYVEDDQNQVQLTSNE